MSRKLLKGKSKSEYIANRILMLILTPAKLINMFANHAKNHILICNIFCFIGIGSAIYFEVRHFYPSENGNVYVLLFLIVMATMTFGYIFLSKVWNKIQEIVMYITNSSCVSYAKARNKVISSTGGGGIGFNERSLLTIDDFIKKEGGWRLFTYKGK